MAKPQDLPSGSAQLQTGILFALVTYVAALASPSGIGSAMLTAAIELSLTAMLFYAGHTIVNHSARFAQAFGGLCGSSAFINLAAIPIFMSPADAELSSIQAFAQFFLLVWSISLLAHVLRHTFETRIVTSIGIAFVFYIVLVSAMEALLPNLSSQTAWLQPAGDQMV